MVFIFRQESSAYQDDISQTGAWWHMDKKPVKINAEGKIDYENAAAFKESILQKIAGQDDVLYAGGGYLDEKPGGFCLQLRRDLARELFAAFEQLVYP